MSLSSHLEQYSDESQPGSGLHDKKNPNYDHPWLSGRTRIILSLSGLASSTPWSGPKHPHAPITRAFCILGLGQGLWLGCANDEITTVSVKSVTEKKTGRAFPHSQARDVC